VIRFFLTYFIFLCCVSSSFAQKYAFRTYSTSDGLPQSQVNSICQDDDGFLWIGTLGGVARFNGDYFKTYSSEDGLHNNRVSCVNWIDKSIWVGHDGGASVIKDSKVKSFVFPEKYKATPVSDIVKFNNQIVISLNGGGLLNASNNKLIEINGLKGEQVFVRDLLVFGDRLYLATREGIFRTKDLKVFSLISSTARFTFSGIAAIDNRLVFSSFADGIFYYDPRTDKVEIRKLADPAVRVFNMTIDQSKTLWLGTQNGVLRIRDNQEDLIDFARGLPTNNVSCVFEDRDKNIWMGTQGKGLVRAPRGEMTYFDNETGLASDLIISGFQAKSGEYYFGTFDIGVVKKNVDASFQVYTLPFNNTVWSAQADVDGKNWFGTKASLLSMDKSGKITLEDGIPGYKITCFNKISPRAMYIGGSEGVVKYSNGKFYEIAKNRLDIGTARNILVLNKRIFVASDLGLFEIIDQGIETGEWV
jgi:ligand-binding sensor domain-containing protein